MKNFDIDIDVQSTTNREKYGTCASLYHKDSEKFLVHPSGIYLDQVPVDAMTGHCAIPYDDSKCANFLKVDLLNNTIYDGFKTKEEVLDAANETVDWSLFMQQSVVERLPHLSKHFDIVQKVEPQHIEDLADILALIRPGKIDLLDEYLYYNRQHVRRKLYKRPLNGGMYFKKSHAIAYAVSIIVFLHSPKMRSLIVW